MLVLGLMSGTSADAIDVALARISGVPPRLSAELLNHTPINFPPQLRKEILRVAEQQPISAGELSQLNFRLGEVFAEAALAACKRFRRRFVTKSESGIADSPRSIKALCP